MEASAPRVGDTEHVMLVTLRLASRSLRATRQEVSAAFVREQLLEALGSTDLEVLGVSVVPEPYTPSPLTPVAPLTRDMVPWEQLRGLLEACGSTADCENPEVLGAWTHPGGTLALYRDGGDGYKAGVVWYHQDRTGGERVCIPADRAAHTRLALANAPDLLRAAEMVLFEQHPWLVLLAPEEEV
jgi:hypothetical protein